MDTARVRAGLTVQDLWLRYVALTGACDVLDLDGYLHGLIPLDVEQQDVLAQALNEALDDSYRAHRIPLSAPRPAQVLDGGLQRVIDRCVTGHLATNEGAPPGAALA